MPNCGVLTLITKTVLVVLDEMAYVTDEMVLLLESDDFELIKTDDERVKLLDFPEGFSVSRTFEASEEDAKKLLAMFGAPQIPLATPWGEPSGFVDMGERRGKKGKFKKDWQR